MTTSVKRTSAAFIISGTGMALLLVLILSHPAVAARFQGWYDSSPVFTSYESAPSSVASGWGNDSFSAPVAANGWGTNGTFVASSAEDDIFWTWGTPTPVVCSFGQPTLTGPATLVAGAPVQFYWTGNITNTSPGGATGCTINNVRATFTIQGPATNDGGPTSFPLGDLLPQSSFQPIRYPVYIPPGTPAGSLVRLTVTLTGDGAVPVSASLTLTTTVAAATPGPTPVGDGQPCTVSADCPLYPQQSCNFIPGINQWQCRTNNTSVTPAPTPGQCLRAGQACSLSNPNQCCSRSCNTFFRRCN